MADQQRSSDSGPDQGPVRGLIVGPAEQSRIRFVVVRGVKYLRLEDVQEYLRTLGNTEEVDVRQRLNVAAQNLGERSPG